MLRAAHSYGRKCAMNLIFGLVMIVVLPFHISFFHSLSCLSLCHFQCFVSVFCALLSFSPPVYLQSVYLPALVFTPHLYMLSFLLFYCIICVWFTFRVCVCQEPYLQAMCDCCSYRLDPQTPVRFLSLHCSSGEKEPVVLPIIQSCECTSCQGTYGTGTVWPHKHWDMA